MNEYLKKRQELILQGRPLPEKKKYTIPKKSEKRKQKEAEERILRGISYISATSKSDVMAHM
jgi:hypothetical protein